MLDTRIVGKCENCDKEYDLFVMMEDEVFCPSCQAISINYEVVDSATPSQRVLAYLRRKHQVAV